MRLLGLLLQLQLANALLAAAAASSSGGITVEGMLEPGTGERRRYSCPARFIRMGNSCYFLSTTMASWHDAHFQCRAMSAHLAAFEKRWEDRNMRHYLLREEMAPLARWIGGIYQSRLRRWMWGSSGQHISYKSFPRRAVTRDWSWHCLSLDAALRYAWKPSSCLERKHFICETPLRRSHRRRKPDAPDHRRRGPSDVRQQQERRRTHRPRPGVAVPHHQGHRRTKSNKLPGGGHPKPGAQSQRRGKQQYPAHLISSPQIIDVSLEAEGPWAARTAQRGHPRRGQLPASWAWAVSSNDHNDLSNEVS